MRIDGSGYSYTLYQNDNHIKIQEKAIAAADAKKADEVVQAPYKEAAQMSNVAGVAGREPQADSGKVWFDLKKENSYQLIGANSKLEDIDVEKALSDMQKDKVLSQYRFFVKPQQMGLGTDVDGTVRRVIDNFEEN